MLTLVNCICHLNFSMLASEGVDVGIQVSLSSYIGCPMKDMGVAGIETHSVKDASAVAVNEPLTDVASFVS